MPWTRNVTLDQCDRRQKATTERGERECDGTVGGKGNSRTGEMEEGVEGGSVMLAVTASLLLSRQPSFSALGIG